MTLRLLRYLPALLALLVVVAARPAMAQLTIEIIGGGGTTVPVAIVPFQNEATYPLGISGIVGADLQRSGLFRLVDYSGVSPRPYQPSEVGYATWRERGADAVAIGRMKALADGRVEVTYHLLDTAKQTQLAQTTYTVTPAQFRATAHRIADEIYEKLTGDKGVFSTKIAYVVKQGSQYSLVVADADGENPTPIVRSPEPLLSPSWSPDGSRIAYVSYENRKPVVYVQSLSTGGRRPVANFPGSNSAPAWTPDGSRLAVTLSRSGGSQIYLIDAEGSEPERLVSSTSIDTEANFSADGNWMLFTSDRGGSPQIYRLDLGSRAVQRMTFEGAYNVSPRFSPDGKSFVYARRDGGHFSLVVQDVATRQTQILTQGALDESPSFAPNGKLILYASTVGGRGILAAVSSDGRVKQRLTSSAGDVREPAWGPLAR